MNIREMRREEIESVWTIDRSEIVNNVYCLRDGKLALHAVHYDMKGWPAGEAELYTPILYDCFDRGGTFFGVFVGSELIAAGVLESKFIGKRKDQLQLKFLHVSCKYRKTGIGRTLFELTAKKARSLGAGRLYISSTPSQNTVDFYLHLGCVVTGELNEELFKMEPDDIHLEYQL